MFTKLNVLARRLQTAAVAGRPVLARADIVRRGNYVPRGSTGQIVRVRPDGDYDIRFDGLDNVVVQAKRHQVAAAPTLAPAGLLARRILSH